jgi:preprotein translocase subunit Sss1
MYIEFKEIAKNCSIGFLIMGAIGFIIKLIFLMINNILLS